MLVHPPTAKSVEESLRDLYPSIDMPAILKDLPDTNLYVYGGTLRDLALQRWPKEADFLLTSSRGKEDFECLVEAHLNSYGFKMLGKTSNSNYHYLPSARADLDSVVDINLAQSMASKTSDFTVNSMYFDVRSGVLLDEHNGLVDLEAQIIRSVTDPNQLFTNKPITIFRAIKCVCQFGFTFEPQTKAALAANAHHAKEALDFIVDNPRTLLGEWMLDNVFRGLKYDPQKYVELCQELGIDTVFLLVIEERLSKSRNAQDKRGIHFDFSQAYTYEESISILFSALVNQFNADNKVEFFEELVEVFGISSLYGYHPVGIDPEVLKYRP